jgi:hypothetical protein
VAANGVCRTSERAGLLLTGVGITAAAVGWSALRRRRRVPGAVGAHAWVVPTEQARTEAAWTRTAMGHASEHKHG